MAECTQVLNQFRESAAAEELTEQVEARFQELVNAETGARKVFLYYRTILTLSFCCNIFNLHCLYNLWKVT